MGVSWVVYDIIAFNDIPTERLWMEARMGGFRISAFALHLFTFIIIFGNIANTTTRLLPWLLHSLLILFLLNPFFFLLLFFLSSLEPPPSSAPPVTQYDIHPYCTSSPLSYLLSSFYSLLLPLLISYLNGAASLECPGCTFRTFLSSFFLGVFFSCEWSGWCHLIRS